MMQSVHLVGEDEDDLYSGFNDYNEAFDTEVSQPFDLLFLKHMECRHCIELVVVGEALKHLLYRTCVAIPKAQI